MCPTGIVNKSFFPIGSKKKMFFISGRLVNDANIKILKIGQDTIGTYSALKNTWDYLPDKHLLCPNGSRTIKSYNLRLDSFCWDTLDLLVAKG